MDWVPLVGGGVDLSQQLAELGDRKVRLTTKERDLLAYLARNPGRTVTRRELLVNVWGNPETGSEEPVYSTVKRLRAKIDSERHRHIVGVHGDGYRWEPAPPPPKTNDAQPARGRFVGRSAELLAVEAAFAAGKSLVSLVGPGGAGKTRCALELAATRPHVFCELTSATSEGTLITAIASALGVPLDGALPSDWVRGVGRVLAAQPGRLVVLDNAEQVIEHVAAVVSAWLPAKPTLLVTSREPLRVHGEHVVALGPLPTPEAISLFTDRVGTDSGAHDDPALYAAIVERVDCLPLAIELAAVQMLDLGARSLLASLSSQLDTLVAGARDAPARHATLRAAVAWSWSFLDERDRAVLADLAVFAGPFSAQAALAVIAADDALARLASLTRRCLIARKGEQFVLYAAVRELAREKGGAAVAAANRHALHFKGAGEAAVELLEGPDHRAGAAALATDLGELRAALRHAQTHDLELAARLALVVDRALGLQAEKANARASLLEGARRGLDDDTLRCRLLLAEGRIEGASPELLDEALLLARGGEQESDVLLARAERSAGTEPAEAKRDLEAALPLAEHAGKRAVRGRILALGGEIAWSLGLVEEASSHLRAALALHLEVADRRATARTSALLAHVDRVESGGGTARVLLEQAQSAADELGDPVVAARVLLDLGQHLTRVGDQAGARAALDLAARTFERLGFARDRAFLHLHVAETLVGIGEHQRALREALAAWSALPEDVGRSTVHEAIGCIHMLLGDTTEAQRWIEGGLDIARTTHAARSECTLLGKRGLIKLGGGDFEAAWADFDAATNKNEARGSIAIAGASLADRAMAAFALGREDSARQDLARARQMLHDPPEHQTQGRMLAACEAVGRGFGQVRAGIPARAAHAETRAKTARFFVRPAHEWDVVLRLLGWLIDSMRLLPDR